MLLHCLEDSARDPLADYQVPPCKAPSTRALQDLMLEPEVEQAFREMAAYRLLSWELLGVAPVPSSSVSRELLLLGCLSSLRLQEEQLARAAPLLSLAGNTSCPLLFLSQPPQPWKLSSPPSSPSPRGCLAEGPRLWPAAR